MLLDNHRLPFRPLRGGIEIFNPVVNEVGTLGFVAMGAAGGTRRWLVSCYHVLVGGPNCRPVPGETVLQSATDPNPVAHVDADRTDPDLDCAAAIIEPAAGWVAEILGLGPLGTPAAPVPGMRIIKSGATTGITEGIVESVNGDDLIIAHTPGFDPNYDLALDGDSGSLWLTRDGLSPVALCISQLKDPAKRIKARCILPILAALQFEVAR